MATIQLHGFTFFTIEDINWKKMASTEAFSLTLQAELRSLLNPEAVVSLAASDDFASSNLRFTDYERPVSKIAILQKCLSLD